MKKLLIKNFMTKKVVSVNPDETLTTAAKILLKNNFDGLPVIDKSGKLLGLITEYNLVSKESAIHLPTFQIILQQLPVFKKDKSRFQKEIQKVSSLRVKNVMNTNPVTLNEKADYREAVKTFKRHHGINPIPIVNAEKKLVGIISRSDMLKIF